MEEANDLLPPKNMDRTNLVDCYHALLLATLMEEGLFDVCTMYIVQYIINTHINVVLGEVGGGAFASLAGSPSLRFY